MMAKKCDRCGAVYEPYNVKYSNEKTNGVAPLNIDKVGKYFSHKPIDFCPNCKDSFDEWLKEEKDYKGKSNDFEIEVEE